MLSGPVKSTNCGFLLFEAEPHYVAQVRNLNPPKSALERWLIDMFPTSYLILFIYVTQAGLRHTI